MNSLFSCFVVRLASSILALVVACFAVSNARAQADLSGMTPDQMLAYGEYQMTLGDPAGAEATFTFLIDAIGERRFDQIGPPFGVAFYGRGMARMQQNKLDLAYEDFEMVTTRFANQPDTPQTSRNPREALGHFQMGSILRIQEEYQQALNRFTNFSDLADQSDFNAVGGAQWEYEHAYCFIYLERLGEARERVQMMIDNRVEYSVDFAMMADILTHYSRKAMETGDEQSAVDLISQNRGMSALATYEAYPFLPNFLNLATEAREEGDYRLFLMMYCLVPTEQWIRETIDLQLVGLAEDAPRGDAPREVESLMDQQVEKQMPHDLIALVTITDFYEKSQNDAAAYAGYRSMEQMYPQTSLRPVILYGATRTAFRLEMLMQAEHYGRTFLREFPDHEYADDVEKFLVESMFFAGKYADALRIARELRPATEDGTEQAEMLDFVIGGSLYFLGQYVEAEPVLSAWPEEYPESTNEVRLEWVAFLIGDNKGKLFRWRQAAPLLEEFLNEYPESVWTNRATYARSQAHYYLNEYAACLERLATIPSTYELDDSVEILRGQAHRGLNEKEEAEAALERGLALALDKESYFTAGEALYNLITLLGEDEERDGDSLAYYDQFMEGDLYTDNPYRPQVAIAGSKPLVRANRRDDSLEDIEAQMLKIGRQNGNPDTITKLVGAYTRVFLSPVEDAELDERVAMSNDLQEFYQDKLINLPSNQIVLKAQIEMALVNLFTNLALDYPEGSQGRRDANAVVTARLRGIRTNYPKESLTNEICMTLADNFFDGGLYSEAANYFGEVVDRGEETGIQPVALLGQAKSLGLTGDTQQVAEAKGLVDRLFEIAPDRMGLLGEAVYFRAQMNEKIGDWDSALDDWGMYIQTEDWREHNPEATFRFAKVCDEHLNDNERAVVMYNRVFLRYGEYFLYSLESWVRSMEISIELEGEESALDEAKLGLSRFSAASDDQLVIDAGYTPNQRDYIREMYNRGAAIANDLIEKFEADE